MSGDKSLAGLKLVLFFMALFGGLWWLMSTALANFQR